MNTDATMPPFETIARSLRRTTERFARELDRPGESPPDWSDLDWAVARATASIQGIAVLLSHRLAWIGPPAWESFLAQQRRQSHLRHELIGDVLARLDLGLREAGVGAVALKGSALRRLDLYAPGIRPMGDIDLLINPQDKNAIGIVLRRLGYVPAYNTRRHGVFRPVNTAATLDFGEHVANPLKIEVHSRIAEPLPVTEVDITHELVGRTVRPGLNDYASGGAILLHLLLHAAGNMRSHALRFIQLNDIAGLSCCLGDSDWRVLTKDEPRWWLYPPLILVERYYPGCFPDRLISRARKASPCWLRFAADRYDLTEVSWSNLRICAFSGVAWSRTPIEAFRLVRARVLPSRAARSEIKLTLADAPHLRSLPWYGESQIRRIARWLLSKPPRVQTMLSVKAALEQTRFG